MPVAPPRIYNYTPDELRSVVSSLHLVGAASRRPELALVGVGKGWTLLREEMRELDDMKRYALTAFASPGNNTVIVQVTTKTTSKGCAPPAPAHLAKL